MIKKTTKTKIQFKNRQEAGQKLAQKLKKLNLNNPIILAIPNGGVIVGNELALGLNCPLGIILVEKIYYPFEKSLGFGAVGNDYGFYSDFLTEGLPKKVIKTQTDRAIKRLKVKKRKFFKTRRKFNLKGETVIITDDALATGLSMLTAIQSIKSEKPSQIIIASPASSDEAETLIKQTGHKLIRLYHHPQGSTVRVSQPYLNYSEISDQRVIKILKKHAEADLS